MPDVLSSAVAGLVFRGYRRTAVSTDPADQYVILAKDRVETFSGRASSVRIAGLAGTAGQKLFSIFNTSATVVVDLETVAFDVYQTAARVVEPPVARLHKVTTAPTGGTAMTKVPMDSLQSSSAAVALLMGGATEKTSAPAIVSTLTNLTNTPIITQEPVARALTLVGYEQYDRTEFINDARPLTLRQNEGAVLNLDYSVATSNPVTDMYTITVRWSEYTRP